MPSFAMMEMEVGGAFLGFPVMGLIKCEVIFPSLMLAICW